MTKKRRNDTIIKSVVVTTKPVVERITLRVLKTVNVEELLKEACGYTQIKILSEKTSGSFKFVDIEGVKNGII